MDRKQAVAFWEEAQYAGYAGLSVKLIGPEAAILKFDANREGNRELVELAEIAQDHNIVMNLVSVYGIAFRDRDDWVKAKEEKGL